MNKILKMMLNFYGTILLPNITNKLPHDKTNIMTCAPSLIRKNKITCLTQPLQFCSKEKHGLLFKEGLLNCPCPVSSELAIF